VTELAPLVAYGFALGWSVAWPPGPINAEMVRRGLARGFRSAFGVGLGACSGDALWALAVVLGAGALAAPAARLTLAWTSTALLLALAIIFLRGAWQGWRQVPAVNAADAAPRFESARGSYLLGLTLALSSPWNLAFWLAVIGRSESQQRGLGTALVIASAVILGAALWCFVLCAAVVRLRLTFSSPVWQVLAQGATGLLMLGFAAQGVWRLTTG
jgi:threonine/homoserine/homoserine lactone efflux protein